MIGTVILLAASALGSHALLSGDVDLTDGVRLVSVPLSNSLEESGRSLGEDSVVYRMAKFLQGHEIHVKLPTLVEREKMGLVMAEALKAVDETNGANAVSGRGKGGGGGGAALLGLMFAKTLGAVGLGGLALLTLKALALSALALVLSAIVGAKKMHSGDDHEDHQVIYAGHGHHRRRRDLPIDTPLPYQGWRAAQPVPQ